MTNHLALKQTQDASLFLQTTSVFFYFFYSSLPETWFKSNPGLGGCAELILESDFSLGSVSWVVAVPLLDGKSFLVEKSKNLGVWIPDILLVVNSASGVMFEGRTGAQDIRVKAIGWCGMKTVQYFPPKKILRTVTFGMGKETPNSITGSPSFPSSSFFFSSMK